MTDPDPTAGADAGNTEDRVQSAAKMAGVDVYTL